MAQTGGRPNAPYAPTQNVVAVIQAIRDHDLPQPVIPSTLHAVGIPEGNAPRTLQALKFLKILQADGYYDQAAERLKLAGTDEYPEMLAEVVRDAYQLVFKMVDPATDPDYRVADAFRQYQPDRQRSRMVTLFMGLCAEAGIVDRAVRSAPSRDTRRSAKTLRPRRTYETVPPAPIPRPATASQDEHVVLPVTEADVAAWNDQEFKDAWAAMGTVVRLTARKRQAARKQVAATDPWAQLFGTSTTGQAPTPEDSASEK